MPNAQDEIFKRLNAANRRVMPLKTRAAIVDFRNIETPIPDGIGLAKTVRMAHDRARNRAPPMPRSVKRKIFPEIRP